MRDKKWTPIFMIFGAILALVQGWSNRGRKDAVFFTFSKLSFECGFRYPFERVWTPIFMIFEAILALIQGWSNNG